MKRYRLIQTACLAALAVGLASCSQDDLASLGVAEGAPVTFTATGLAMPQVETRATTDGTWEEGMMVGVKIGSEAKEYAVSPDATDPTKATLAATQGVTPFYWANATETKSVEAWYPYTAGQTAMPSVVVQQDQSVEANYLASDLLGTSQEVSYGDPDLQFAHRTAKITLNFTETEGSRFSMKDAEVVLYNLSTTNGNPATIRCFKATGDGTSYHALIAPQTFAAGNALFYVKFADGSPHSYTPDAAIEFKAGYEYVFDVKVSDWQLIVTPPSVIAWGNGNIGFVDAFEGEGLGAGDYITFSGGVRNYFVKTEAGLRAWANYTNKGYWDTNLTLLGDITLDINVDWVPIGQAMGKTSDAYTGTIEGNGHTIDNMRMKRRKNKAAMVITLSGTIRNLNIGGGSEFVADFSAGSFAVNNNGGKIINCHSAAYVVVEMWEQDASADWIDDVAVGGIVANNGGDNGDSYVIGCSFSGNADCLINYIEKEVTFYNGGIVGRNQTSGTGTAAHVVGCVSTGSKFIVIKDTESYILRVGGVVGSNNKIGSDVTNVTACASPLCEFTSLYLTLSDAEYTAIDGGIGYLANNATATHIYWIPIINPMSGGTLGSPYRSPGSSYPTLMEVDGTDVSWATATENMNTAIKEWNATNGNLCPYHYEQTNGADQPPTLVEGAPN